MHVNITSGLHKGLETFTTEESHVSRMCYGKQTRHEVQMLQVLNKVDPFDSKLVLAGILQQENYKAMQYPN
jgi:hypothetical protein